MKQGKKDKPIKIEKAYRVSAFKKVMVDWDRDGNTGFEENEDLDKEKEITVFDELLDLALVGQGRGERLYFVNITEPHKPNVIGWMPTPDGAYRAVRIPDKNMALLAGGKWILVIDLTNAHYAGKLDENEDGEDDRILYKTEIPGGRAQDIRFDESRGLAYVLQKDIGLLVLRLETACSKDFGVDATYVPIDRIIRYSTLEDERRELLKGIKKGFASDECKKFFKIDPRGGEKTNAALLSQGSSACIWPENGQCSTAYQPGSAIMTLNLSYPSI